MATINFQYRGTKETGKLSIRLIHGSDGIDYRVSTPIVSKKEYWFKRTSKNGKTVVKQRKLNELNFSEEVKNHKSQLEVFTEQIIQAFHTDFNNGLPISRQWLKITIDKVLPILDNKSAINVVQEEKNDEKLAGQKKQEFVYKSNLISTAIDKMDVKYATNKNELKKYKVLMKRLIEFQEYQNEIFKTIDLNQDFADNFMNWAFIDMEYSKSYINSLLKRLRRAVVNAYENDDFNVIKISKKLKTFKVFKNVYKDKIVITLNYDDLDIIDEAEMPNQELDDAKKAILLECETGLRYSDFNKLNDSNLKTVKGFECWEFETKKTVQLVRIPKNDRIVYLLNKYGIPKTDYKDDGKVLNENVKKVCRISKLNYSTEGDKISSLMIKGEKRKRILRGSYPKYKLISTRTFRRSFATNYYGKIDIALIMAITGHKTERALRAYINVTDESNVSRTVEQINSFHRKRSVAKKMHLEVVGKEAN